jgi:hypothetical protein
MQLPFWGKDFNPVKYRFFQLIDELMHYFSIGTGTKWARRFCLWANKEIYNGKKINELLIQLNNCHLAMGLLADNRRRGLFNIANAKDESAVLFRQQEKWYQETLDEIRKEVGINK